MNVLVLTDPLGNEIYINPEHVSHVQKVHGDLHPVTTKAIVHFVDGSTQSVQETAGAVCFRMLEL